MSKFCCPTCGSTVDVDFEFAKSNGRVFCETCCKAFDIEIEESSSPSEDEYTWDKAYFGILGAAL